MFQLVKELRIVLWRWFTWRVGGLAEHLVNFGFVRLHSSIDVFQSTLQLIRQLPVQKCQLVSSYASKLCVTTSFYVL